MRSRAIWLGSLAAIATGWACGSAGTSPGASCVPDSGRACPVDASAGESGSGLASPPPPGPMQPANGTGVVTFAMSAILWGNTDPDGTPDSDAWQQYGYNIDGVDPSDVAAFCQPPQGGSATSAHEEGIDGIENAFGHNVLALLPSNTTVCLNLCCGIYEPFTILLSLDQLGAGSSYDPLPSGVASGTELDVDAGNCGIAIPHFDGTDVWSVFQGTSESLPTSYLVNDTWVSGPIARLSLMYQGLGTDPDPPMVIDIVHARITMKLDPTHGTATAGVISGVIPTADLQQSLMTLAGTTSTSLCTAPVLQNLLVSIAQASDIMQDGTQDPTKTCDGISIGLGFTASVDQLGPTVAAMNMTDPCEGDAGTGD